MGEAMKKMFFGLFMLLQGVSPLFAEGDVHKLKRRTLMINGSGVPGWCSDEKAAHFLDLVLTAEPKVCVEIGVFGGGSLFPVASGLKFLGRGIAIGIDPWDNSECIKNVDPIEEREHVDWWSKANLMEVYYIFLDKLILFELEDYIKIIKKNSVDAAPEIDTIDILHIDGHRSEEQTLKDVRLYFPKVVPGGYIWMGDCLSFNKQKALDLLLELCDVDRVIDNGNCVLFKKR